VVAAAAPSPTPTPAPAAVATPQPWPQPRPVLQEMVAEIEESLGDSFVPEPKRAKQPEVKLEPAHPQGSEFRSGTLDDFVTDLEASLGSDFLPEAATAPVAAAPTGRNEAPIAKAAAAAAAAAPSSRPADKGAIQRPSTLAASAPVFSAPPPAATKPSAPPSSPAHLPKPDPGPSVDLADMFGELKQELESGGTGADEDPETHYNLGVAFREMGLLDEAIGELQKVVQSVEHGHAFPQMIQTYTWLAQCFLDKGVPEVAVRWYEKALQLPSLDQETKTALHYELGSAQESAGNKTAALNNFLEAYGSNIDYRDVGERIKALRP
jgi:hypothetical protein